MPSVEAPATAEGEPTASSATSAAAPGAESGAPADSADAASPAAGTDPSHRSPAEVGRLLAERFPALFGPGVVKPIKLRIQVDLQARAPGLIGRRSLSIFLQRHTTSTAYLKALIAAQHRFDLDGQAAGEIAAEHRAAAQVELDRRRQIVAERRAAERGQRPAAGRPPREQRAPQPPVPGAAVGDAATAVDLTTAPSARPAIREGQRAPRPGQPPRPGQGQRPQGAPGRSASQTNRPPQGRGPSRAEPRRPGGPAERPQEARPPRDAQRPARPAAPERIDTSPDAAARRSRSQLLQAFEASPLSKANFCALKGLRESEFDALIAEARADRAARTA